MRNENALSGWLTVIPICPITTAAIRVAVTDPRPIPL
jgi:hypothetical protein